MAILPYIALALAAVAVIGYLGQSGFVVLALLLIAAVASAAILRARAR